MCDTMVNLAGDSVMFAKNSDRDANEAQVIEWQPAAEHASGARVRATWIEIPQVNQTHAIAISRPWWMWGAEIGANEHGVVIGNEALFTKESLKGEPGLLGMDLLRLALERSTNRDEALNVIIELLEEYGQVGSCSYEKPQFTYHNSFLIADPKGAVVLETAGKHWATEHVVGPARSISNGLTIPDFAKKFSDPLRSKVSACGTRRSLTERRTSQAHTVADLMAVLRDNGNPGSPRWSWFTGSMQGPNMHAGGFLASSQTTASWVSDLSKPGLHWATATSDPALSVFKPIFVDQSAYLGPEPKNFFDPATLWWRHERFRRYAIRDWATAEALIAEDRDSIEAEWIMSEPDSAAAFAQSDRLLEIWENRLLQVGLTETRPGWLTRRWATYDKQAKW